MYNIISIFNSELPICKLFDLYTNQDDNVDDNTKKNTRNTYLILLLVFKILIWVYSIYLLYKCLSQRNQSGEHVNGVCEIIVAVCCMPCWLIYRSFINRCSSSVPNVQQQLLQQPLQQNVPQPIVQQPLQQNVPQPIVQQPNLAEAPQPIVQQPNLAEAPQPIVQQPNIAEAPLIVQQPQ